MIDRVIYVAHWPHHKLKDMVKTTPNSASFCQVLCHALVFPPVPRTVHNTDIDTGANVTQPPSPLSTSTTMPPKSLPILHLPEPPVWRARLTTQCHTFTGVLLTCIDSKPSPRLPSTTLTYAIALPHAISAGWIDSGGRKLPSDDPRGTRVVRFGARSERGP